MIKVLIVDDDFSFTMALRDNLEYEGYEVSCAFDGKQGMLLYEDRKPDLVITDIIMPEMDGLEFVSQLASAEGEFPCKLIAISGGGRIKGKEYLDVVKKLGVETVLEKTFMFADLLKDIVRLLLTNTVQRRRAAAAGVERPLACRRNFRSLNGLFGSG